MCCFRRHPLPERNAALTHRVFDRCATPIGESVDGVWKGSIKKGSVFGDSAEWSTPERGDAGGPRLQ